MTCRAAFFDRGAVGCRQFHRRPAHADTLTVAHNGGVAGPGMREAYFKPFTAKTGHQVTRRLLQSGTRQDPHAGRDEEPRLGRGQRHGDQRGDGLRGRPAREGRLVEGSRSQGFRGRRRLRQVRPAEQLRLRWPDLRFGGHTRTRSPKSWADFWDVKKYPGKRGLLYRAEQTMEVALMADGVEPKDAMKVLAAPGGVERAFKKLAELKPLHHLVEERRRVDAEHPHRRRGDDASRGTAASPAPNRATTASSRSRSRPAMSPAARSIAIMKGTPRRISASTCIKTRVVAGGASRVRARIDYAPANAKGYALHDRGRDAPRCRSGHMHRASLQIGQLYFDFWLNNGDALLQRFITSRRSRAPLHIRERRA